LRAWEFNSLHCIVSGGVVVQQTFNLQGATVEAAAILIKAMRTIEQNTIDAILIDAANAGPMSRLGR